MTDEVDRLRALAEAAAESERELMAETADVRRLCDIILAELPDDPGVAAASVMMAFMRVAAGLEHHSRGCGVDLIATAIHNLAIVAAQIQTPDA